MKKNLKLISMLFCMLLLLVSCGKQDTSLEETNRNESSMFEFESEIIESEIESESETVVEMTEEMTEETTKVGFEGRIIPSMYEDYYMYWDNICVLIVTYTPLFEGAAEFGMIGYNGTENPVLFCGNTKANGYGEYDMYCFKDNRVYKSDETVKGKLYYNSSTKEFAALGEDSVCNIYMYYGNHIIWLRAEGQVPEGFETMKLTSNACTPPPMVENIRSFIIY